MKIISLCLLALTAASAIAQPLPIENVRIALTHPAQETAERRNVVFAPDMEPTLAFDLYRPAGAVAGARLPVIIFLSGTDRARNWKWFEDLGQLAAAHGFAAVVPDKRYPRGWDGLLSGTADTKRVLRYLAEHSAELGIDPQRLCVWSFSGGGRLNAAALAADVPRAACLLNFYGLLDLTDELASVADETRRNELLAQYSPSHVYAALGADAPPWLVIRAGRDGAVINRSIDRLVASALAANAPLTLINSPEAVHGFDGQQHNDESRRLIAAALEFARVHLTAQRTD
ncbi:MAG: hypothetical protein C0518_15535 [Opitutus sp.]|nr:hypothetical protein [Opitutus sp.]